MIVRNLALHATALLVLAVAAGPAHAERVRYHFRPADLCGNTAAITAGTSIAIGERVSYFGTGTAPYNCPMKPNYLVTFRHPYTRQNVTVPLALPPDTPRIEHLPNRIVFDYGSYTVETLFLPDGSVDTIYDSGLFRPLR